MNPSENNVRYDTFDQLISKVDMMSKNNKKIISVRDAILTILYAKKNKPIHGRIMLFKEIFLLYEEVLKNNSKIFEIQSPEFVPYRYGPYSFDVADVLNHLHYDDFVNISGRKNSISESFTITERGVKEIIVKYNSLPENIKKEIVDHRVGWDQLGTDGILRYVYENFEEYTDRSEIKEKYKHILWGRGKG
jgi:uncharacterized protein YwgA